MFVTTSLRKEERQAGREGGKKKLFFPFCNLLYFQLLAFAHLFLSPSFFPLAIFSRYFLYFLRLAFLRLRYAHFLSPIRLLGIFHVHPLSLFLVELRWCI